MSSHKLIKCKIWVFHNSTPQCLKLLPPWLCFVKGDLFSVVRFSSGRCDLGDGVAGWGGGCLRNTNSLVSVDSYRICH